jgi:hypothetical protein
MPGSKPRQKEGQPAGVESAATAAAIEDTGATTGNPSPGSPEAVGALIASPCLDRGAPINFATVPARVGDRIIALFALCSSPGSLVMFLQPISITAQPVAPIVQQAVDSSTPVVVDLGTIEAGRYLLFWKFLPFSEPWQAVTEVAVNGVTRFRRYDTSDDNIPGTRVAVALEVLA